MSGLSLAVAPRPGPTTEKDPSDGLKHRQRTVMGGVMGSSPVIGLRPVASIMVFFASGLVPILDMVFPAFASAYILAVALLISFRPSATEIRETEVRSDGRAIIPFNDFGFAHNGTS